MSRAVLLEKVRGVDGIVSLLTDRIDGEVLDGAGPQCKVVANVAVGYDYVDVAACTARGVLVTNTPGVLTEASADHAMALILSAARRVPEGQAYARAGKWKTFGFQLLLGMELNEATLGIVGLGRIGQGVARRARPFGLTLLATGSRHDSALAEELGVTYVSKDELLERSDIVSLHCPLKPETIGYIGAAELRAMKRTSILVNTARGPVVNTDALYQALCEGEIASAALDVTDPEPLPAEHLLYGLDNCLIVPHTASATVSTRTRMASMAAANLIAAMTGATPPNPVN